MFLDVLESREVALGENQFFIDLPTDFGLLPSNFGRDNDVREIRNVKATSLLFKTSRIIEIHQETVENELANLFHKVILDFVPIIVAKSQNLKFL